MVRLPHVPFMAPRGDHGTVDSARVAPGQLVEGVQMGVSALIDGGEATLDGPGQRMREIRSEREIAHGRSEAGTVSTSPTST